MRKKVELCAVMWYSKITIIIGRIGTVWQRRGLPEDALFAKKTVIPSDEGSLEAFEIDEIIRQSW